MSKIERSVAGVTDFLLEKVEEIDSSELEVRDRTKLVVSLLSQVKQFAGLELQHKQMLMKGPDVVKNRSLQMLLGSEPKKEGK